MVNLFVFCCVDSYLKIVCWWLISVCLFWDREIS